jgi:hypothetical protein
MDESTRPRWEDNIKADNAKYYDNMWLRVFLSAGSELWFPYKEGNFLISSSTISMPRMTSLPPPNCLFSYFHGCIQC